MTPAERDRLREWAAAQVATAPPESGSQLAVVALLAPGATASAQQREAAAGKPAA